MIQAIIVIISILIGYFLRDLSINRIKQHTERAYKRIRGNRSSEVAWAPPKSAETQAEEKIREKLKE